MSRVRRRRRETSASDQDMAAPPQEAPAARRRRLNKAAKDGKAATVVDRSGAVVHLERAAKSLKHACAEQRVLRVPQWDMKRAAEAMRKAGVSGVVSNLSGTRKMKVRPRRDLGAAEPKGPGL